MIRPFQAKAQVGHSPWFHTSFTIPNEIMEGMSVEEIGKLKAKYRNFNTTGTPVFVADDRWGEVPPTIAVIHESYIDGQAMGPAVESSEEGRWVVPVHDPRGSSSLGLIPYSYREARPEEIPGGSSAA